MTYRANMNDDGSCPNCGQDMRLPSATPSVPRANAETPSDTHKELRERILAERDKGNIVFWGLPDELMTANLDEFVKQDADGMLYDLNRLEEISLTFLSDPKWVNDFAVALTIRKLVAQRDELAAKPANAEKDAERWRWIRKMMTWASQGNGEVKWVAYIKMKSPNIEGDLTDESVPLQLDAAIDAALAEQILRSAGDTGGGA